MMKIINYLEKSKAFWFLLFLIVFFFLLRLPSLIEPHWYGDEGIYQVLGDAINQGRVLYSEAWDNKPPMLYLTYALFQSDQFAIRLASLISGLLAAIALFFLSQSLFKRLSASIIATLLFAFLFATPLLEGNIANAENFILFPIIAAGLVIYHLATQPTKYVSSRHTHYLFIAAGLFLGIAFLFKTVAFFDLVAFSIFIVLAFLPEKLSWRRFQTEKKYHAIFMSLGRNLLFLLLGFVAPFLVTIVWFAAQGALSDFLSAAFSGNIGYVGWKNDFIIPHGFLFLKILLLLLALSVILLKKSSLSKAALFIFLWAIFSLFNSYFSGRPYTHYVLVSLPSFCLLVGLFFATQQAKMKLGVLVLTLLFGSIIMLQFSFYPLQKSLLYYQNAYLFIAGQREVSEYQAFFDSKTPRDYEIASFIKKHTSPEDTIFLWGDSAQIYTLSDKLPPGKYTVAYHMLHDDEALEEMQTKIDTVKPKYVLILEEAPEFPFRLTYYSNPFTVNKVTIYERDN